MSAKKDFILAANLWRALGWRGMSRRELCEEAGVAENTLQRIMSGKSCNVATLMAICLALDVEPNELLIDHDGDPTRRSKLAFT